MILGGPKVRNRTELISSSCFEPGQTGGRGGGRKGQNPIGLSFGPPVLQGPVPSGNARSGREHVEDYPASAFVLPSSTPASRFLSRDEAALFDERAGIREYDGGISRAAAERLAWLDVLAARQAVTPAAIERRASGAVNASSAVATALAPASNVTAPCGD
jgi:hypothetical protein